MIHTCYNTRSKGLHGHRVLLIVILVFVGTFLSSRALYLYSPTVISRPTYLNDFIEYWAAARLLSNGNNPYSPEQLLTLQQSIGWIDSSPLLMWNPPWTLFFLLPFGLMSYPTGKALWLALHYAIVLFCSFELWRLYGGQIRSYWIAWVISFTFLPTFLVLSTGQIGSLVLLGIVAFLYFEERKMWWCAGAVTVLVAIKPHLCYLFWPALLLWALDTRRWLLILGAGIAFLITTITPLFFTPGLIGQYFQLYSTANAPTPFYWETPTLGYLLRRLLVVQNPLLQFAPSLLGVLWFLWYWTKHRQEWNWSEQLPSLLLVSSATTFFAWTMDLIVLLPAVIQVAVRTLYNPRRGTAALVAVTYLGINAVAIMVIILAHNALWSFWIAPTLLVAYSALRSQINLQYSFW